MAAKEIVNRMRDPLTVLKILGIAAGLFLAWLAMYGNAMWYGKEAGVALEDTVTALEHKSDMQHALQVQQNDHTKEKLTDIETSQKENHTELIRMIKDYFPHSNPGQ